MSERILVADAKRVVVKIGSSSLTATDGTLSQDRVTSLVKTLADLKAAGKEIVLVSSGAMAAGLPALSLAKRPKDLARQQAAAAVGQGLLIHRYATEFAKHGVTVGQVLLTVEDAVRKESYGNTVNTLNTLLAMGVVPIVNENDTVATAELRFGDNDRLAALVAHQVKADLLVVLSDVDGLYDRSPAHEDARILSTVHSLEEIARIDVSAKGSGLGTGGMATKLEAVRLAVESGVTVVVGRAVKASKILAGEEVGTLFKGSTLKRRPSLQTLWLRHVAEPSGALILDDGAVAALVEQEASLLAVGVRAVRGEFLAGDAVDLLDESGNLVARGLSSYGSEEVAAILLLSKEQRRTVRPLVRRDYLARLC